MMTSRQRDLIVALLFVGLGTGGALLASQYRLMMNSRVGPGAFPLVLAVTLIVIGLVQFVIAWREETAEKAEPFVWRPILAISLAVVAFGISVERIGVFPALLLATGISACAGPRLRVLDVAVTLIVMGVFVYVGLYRLLNLPLKLF